MSLRAAARIRLLRSLLCSSSRPIFNALKTYNALKSTCQVSQPVDITCRPRSTISALSFSRFVALAGECALHCAARSYASLIDWLIGLRDGVRALGDGPWQRRRSRRWRLPGLHAGYNVLRGRRRPAGGLALQR